MNPKIPGERIAQSDAGHKKAGTHGERGKYISQNKYAIAQYFSKSDRRNFRRTLPVTPTTTAAKARITMSPMHLPQNCLFEIGLTVAQNTIRLGQRAMKKQKAVLHTETTIRTNGRIANVRENLRHTPECDKYHDPKIDKMSSSSTILIVRKPMHTKPAAIRKNNTPEKGAATKVWRAFAFANDIDHEGAQKKDIHIGYH